MLNSLLKNFDFVLELLFCFHVVFTQNFDAHMLVVFSVDSMPRIPLTTGTNLLEQSELVDHHFVTTTILNHLVLKL